MTWTFVGWAAVALACSPLSLAADGAVSPEIHIEDVELFYEIYDAAHGYPTTEEQLRRLDPDARFPPVTIAVSRGKPAGIGYPDSGIQVGLEAVCASDFLNPNVEDRFVHLVAHEYVHVQQAPALAGRAGAVRGTDRRTREGNRDRIPRGSGPDRSLRLARQQHVGSASPRAAGTPAFN